MSAININRDNFKQEVLNSDKPVLVDFWAPWCGPCRMLAPIIDKLADQYENKIAVCKVDVDEVQDLAIKYGIQTIPTVIFFKDGQLTAKEIGVKPLTSFTSMLDSQIA